MSMPKDVDVADLEYCSQCGDGWPSVEIPACHLADSEGEEAENAKAT